ncbi:MAG: 2-C-methyl-D-erythritol 4-phosphate cytidylyltransferase [Paludibacteraceae bacterium]|nr:2-C-methyl-D-erythritol 4-phosphate cytidylyltransferase [Paludibacteraceae bacterium]
MDIYIIIVAGGRGTRMGGVIPKQFLYLHSRPILMRTIDAFVKYAQEAHYIVVLPEDQHTYWQRLCEKHAFTLPHHVVSGGANRFESVKNALSLVPDTKQAVVVVHDGVRPLVSQQLIRRCINEAANSRRCVVPVVELTDSVRQLEGEVSYPVDRSHLRLVQTPQAFPADILKHAYRLPYSPVFTDDASVVEAAGGSITLVTGEQCNIKITHPDDMLVAQAIFRTK